MKSMGSWWEMNSKGGRLPFAAGCDGRVNTLIWQSSSLPPSRLDSCLLQMTSDYGSKEKVII